MTAENTKSCSWKLDIAPKKIGKRKRTWARVKASAVLQKEGAEWEKTFKLKLPLGKGAYTPLHFDSLWHFPLLFFKTSKSTTILARTFSQSPLKNLNYSGFAGVKHLAYSGKEKHFLSIFPFLTHAPEKCLFLGGGTKGCSDPAPQAYPHAWAAGKAPTFHYHHCLNKGL